MNGAIKIFFEECRFASGARCAPRVTALTRGLLAIRSCRSGFAAASITLILARVKNSALELGLEMSTMLLLPASRGQVELFGEQPTREPTTISFPSHSLARSFLILPLGPRSSTLVPFLLRPSLSPSLSVSFISAGSFVHRGGPQARQLEEGPSGPIYRHASCDNPAEGFQKYTKVVPN